MKRFGNLYDQVCTMDNIRLAHQNAKKGKFFYREVQMVDANPDKYFKEIQDLLINKVFENSDYTVFTKKDHGKNREIYKLPYYPDRIIHHCIMNILEPIWMKTLIRDTYSSLKGRGIHDGVKRLKKSLKNTNNTKYCLKMDVKKFYPSINHDVLKRIIRKKIKDVDLLWLLDKIIDSAEGVPIGNYLSQYFGNLYLSSFDHWLKEAKKCRYYFRYCDDMVILHNNKKYLHFLRQEIQDYLWLNLKLELKNNWQVFPTKVRGIDFLGYRFFGGDRILLRRSIANSFKLKIGSIRKHYYTMSEFQIINGIMSYYGWIKYCSKHNLWEKVVDKDIKYIINNTCKKSNISNPLRSNNNDRK